VVSKALLIQHDLSAIEKREREMTITAVFLLPFLFSTFFILPIIEKQPVLLILYS